MCKSYKLLVVCKHIACLDTKGRVFVIGQNEHAQNGSNTEKNTLKPVWCKIPHDSISQKKVVEIKCGDFHVCARTSNNEWWIWGADDFNQCSGLDDSYSNTSWHNQAKMVKYPLKVQFNEVIGNHATASVVDVCLGSNRTMVIVENKLNE